MKINKVLALGVALLVLSVCLSGCGDKSSVIAPGGVPSGKIDENNKPPSPSGGAVAPAPFVSLFRGDCSGDNGALCSSSDEVSPDGPSSFPVRGPYSQIHTLKFCVTHQQYGSRILVVNAGGTINNGINRTESEGTAPNPFCGAGTFNLTLSNGTMESISLRPSYNEGSYDLLVANQGQITVSIKMMH